MKYVCLVYYPENEVGRMTPAQWDALNRECIECGESLRATGHMVGGSALEPTRTSITLRVRNGKVTTTDGPFAETREQLAGFYLLEARDLNEAIQLAARIPPARLGSIEIRPARELAADASGRFPGRPGD